MNKPQIEFYQSFYGPKFYRHFRRPTDQNNPPKFRTQITVKNPEAIMYHVKRTNGHYPSYLHVYNQNNSQSIDRAFFDFDINHSEAKATINELQDLRRYGLQNEIDKQIELKIRLKELIIQERIAKPAIDESIKFAKIFKNSFGTLPFLLFSGCKGAHVYTFFEPIKFINFNNTITWFAERVKKIYKIETLDLAVNRDALSRLSRVLYSKHQYTDLTVVPFQIDDTYDTIMHKTLNPQVEPFNKEDYITEFNLYLQNTDKELKNLNNTFRSKKRNISSIYPTGNGQNQDYKQIKLRKPIKNILGQPIKEYSKYDFYNCPFHHPDNNPSFAVYETNYHCFGCGKHGNYWQFLKDYNGWNNNQVRNYLKKQKERI